MKRITLGIFLSILGAVVFGQNAKVVGYFPSYRFASSTQVEYCRLTHLNLCFANPDSAGNILMPDISSVMSDALAENPDIIICISLAGGGLTSQQAEDWANLIDIPANRPAFISKIVDYVLTNNLDGVDVDLEWDRVTAGYSDFVTELDTALSPYDMIVTAAFPNQTLFANVSDAALEAFDFINIMSYDATGPWRPSSPGQHSSYTYSTNGINFWKNSAGVPGEKLTLGVPFYGYDFISSTTANAFTYGSMVQKDESYADLDQVETAYYNGIPTIESKVNLANDEVGGIMIWELGQDSFDDYSLLKTIHEKYTSLEVLTSGLCGNVLPSSILKQKVRDTYKLYPNPASAYLIIKYESDRAPEVIVSNSLGQRVSVGSVQNNGHELHLDLKNLQSGFYFIMIMDEVQGPTMKKFVVN